MSPPTTHRGHRIAGGPWSAAAVLLACLILPARSEATPAFARQFNAECHMCHSPIPPRLNKFGLTFKRMGFRLPDVDDKGNLILKNKPSKGMFDDFSLIGDFRGESHRDEPVQFTLDEVMARGAGALNKYVSYNTEAMWSEDMFELSAMEGQILLGRPTVNVTARFGILNPLLWDRADHTLGVTSPLVLTTPTPAGEFAGSALQDARRGAEIGLNWNHMPSGGGAFDLRGTFLAVGVFNRLAGGGSMPEGSTANGMKDVLVQAVHVWGESNSIGALWYRGRVFNIGQMGFEDRTDRWAVMGNHQFPSRTDVVGGVGYGRDATTSPDLGLVRSRGWFLEADQVIAPDTVALVRYDRFDPDRSTIQQSLRGPTVGMTSHVLNNLFLTVEYQGLRPDNGTRNRDIVVRAIIAY